MLFLTTFYMLLVEYMYILVVSVKVASPVAMGTSRLYTSVYVALLYT